jgi:dihydrofolate synthase/folylpolyglutamate synthase
MTYKDALAFMFEQMPMYQQVGLVAYKANLDNTIALMKACGNPEQGLVCIHIAGTNGKGSTAHMLASIFQAAGYKTGLYTSPHLFDFRERIKINGEGIPETAVVDFIQTYQANFKSIQPSFFEVTVAMAFQYFRKAKTDIAIIETGLGGRLDSTNVVLPEVSVITNISLDHTHILGNTFEAIAKEKGGIIKQGIDVVVGDSDPAVNKTLSEIAQKNNAPFYLVDHETPANYSSDLVASYQQYNINTVVKTIAVISSQQRFKLTNEHIEHGLANVCRTTGFAGRWQLLQEHPKVIVDVGHNLAGWIAILSQLRRETYNQLHIVFGSVNDKVLDDIIKVLPKTAYYHLCAANISRAYPLVALEKLFQENKLTFSSHVSVAKAYGNALNTCHSDDLILVAGSLFVVGEVLEEKN